MLSRRYLILALSLTMLQLAKADNDADLFRAVRDNNLAFLKQSITKAALDARDRRGATLLMHAAAFGNLEILKLLLDSGANVNARNAFDATPLLWAARDPEKARLLVDRGADVNARSKQGRTPLMLASLLHGGSPLLAMLLEKGAKVNVQDGRGDTALGLAAGIGEVESMRLLLARGADPRIANSKGETPITLAAKSQSAEAVRLLLEKGVDVNLANTASTTVRHGPLALVRLTPLHHAAAFGPAEMVRDLLKAGAKVDPRDVRGLTPLIVSCATEYPSLEIVRALLAAGAAVNAKDFNGESAFDWAEKFGNPTILAELKKAGAERHSEYQQPKRPAVPAPTPSEALARSITLIERSSGEFFRQSGCVGCHHQPLVARTQRAARAARAAVDDNAAREQTAQLKGQWMASQEEFLQSLNPGGGPNRLAENLLGLAAAGSPPDIITDSAIVDLAEAQAVDGSWPAGEEQPRPPITESIIGATSRAIGAIRAYAIPARRAEFDARIARACAWLQKTKPVTTDDFAMRLVGLARCGAPQPHIEEATLALIDLQREDGGWGGNQYLNSDAFATGQALTALAESGAAPLTPFYRRGIQYLLATQFPDGSWHVRSRAVKFQPYFESGFPFGHDQWISAAATAWAAQAISYTVEPRAVRAAAH